MRTVIAAAFALLLAPVVSGHHSDAALDLETVVTLEGTVTEFSLQNPHTYFSVETTNAAGEAVEWSVQMGSGIASRRAGWRPDTLTVGDRVTFSAHPAKDGRPYGLFVSIQDSEGVDLPVALETAPPQTVASATTLEGKWVVDEASLVDYPGGLDELTRRDLTLTAKGAAALAEYDDNSTEDNPLLSCIGRPTPGPIIYTDLYPMQFVFDEGAKTITIRSQFFDNERTVYMDGRGHPRVGERYHEGYSVGHWEGDTLVVDTRNFTDHRSPYQNGIPSGAQKRVVERYELADDGTRVAVVFTVEDPEYFVGTLTHRRALSYAPHLDMTPFDCSLDSTRRFLPD